MTIDRGFYFKPKNTNRVINIGTEGFEIFRFTHKGKTLFRGKDITKLFSKIVSSEDFEKLVEKYQND